MVLLAACSDSTTENVMVSGDRLSVVSKSSDLPECGEDNEGSQAFVKNEKSFVICIGGEWEMSTRLSAGDTVYIDAEMSCTTKELDDKSGNKLICNGDSIGVILNGAKGDAGADGTDGKEGKEGKNGKNGTVDVDTTVVGWVEQDSEKVAVSLDSLAGYSQKGPFVKGSTVYLYELENGYTLKQTNGNFTSNITRDDGRYKFTIRNLVSPYVMLLVDGNYRNEVTGKMSNKAIKLKAISNVRLHKTANVNLLTDLEFERVYYLVTKQKLSVLQAKSKAQKEILSHFHITLDKTKDAEDMDVIGSSDADGALLAISILLQGDRSESDLTALLTEISNDLAEDGIWKDASTMMKLADWTLEADVNGRFLEFREHVTGWKLSKTVPYFEKHLRLFAGIETQLGVCGSDSVPVGTVKNVPNEKSKFYTSSYTDTTGVGKKNRFICIDADSLRWRLATDIEKDTVGWGRKVKDGTVRNGVLNSEVTYVFDGNSWRKGTELDSLLGVACVKSNLGDTSALKVDGLYYVCSVGDSSESAPQWVKAPDFYNDTYDAREECSPEGKYGDGSLLAGRVNSETLYTCDGGEFRLVDSLEKVGNRGCVSYIRNEDYVFEKQKSYYKCTENGWKFDVAANSSTLEDSRDKKTYRIVTIGNQTVMAENLNFDYKVPVEDGSSDSISYGRSYREDGDALLGSSYSWAAVMDSAAVFSEGSIGCGNNDLICRVDSPARGICPEGWHVPTKDEFDTLFMTMGSTWRAVIKTGLDFCTNEYDSFGNSVSPSDDYGFSAIPVDDYCGAYFWTADQFEGSYIGSEYACKSYLWGFAPTVLMAQALGREYQYALRCFKDE